MVCMYNILAKTALKYPMHRHEAQPAVTARVTFNSAPKTRAVLIATPPAKPSGLYNIRHADFYLRSHLVCSDIMGTRTTSDNLLARYTDPCYGIRQVYPRAERPLKEGQEINLEYTTIVRLRISTIYSYMTTV